MATCERCGQWMGQVMKPTPPMPAVPGSLVCSTCRLRVWRGRIELFVAIVLAIAATIIVAGMSWQRTDPIHWPAEPGPSGPQQSEPQHVDPEPGEGGAAPEELPRIPSSKSTAVMSLDY